MWCSQFQLYSDNQCTYPYFLGTSFTSTSTSQNILSKPLAAFPCNHGQNNDQQCEGVGIC